jgi:hypothetical protein
MFVKFMRIIALRVTDGGGGKNQALAEEGSPLQEYT